MANHSILRPGPGAGNSIFNIAILFLLLTVMIASFSIKNGQHLLSQSEINSPTTINLHSYPDESQLAARPEELIRFHVLANSDSDEDQALKRAVRDAILERVSPRLAESHSLEESRKILTALRPEMEQIGQKVVQDWGKTYEVRTDYGHFAFPTKSYGSLVLPAGEYEAVRVLIGKAEGSNWWCVLFPPLCFVDIEHSTAVQVDGKPGIPIQHGTVVKFWLWEKLKERLK